MQFTLTTDSRGTQYKVTEAGTAYHRETPDDLVEILERLRANGTRIKLDYGDTKTGESWGEVNDITGRIGRSTGTIKIPLLIHNSRSYGGGAMLDNCIIGIEYSNKNDGGTIYRLKVAK